MKRNKIFLGSIALAILMLVTTQIAFFSTVKSDPDVHFGDAYVGDIWISELNVSSATSEFEDVFITHINASDDWVCWNNSGIYNINASWEIDIDSTDHPDFQVIYAMNVYYINDSNLSINWNTNYSGEYNANQTYNESGMLNVTINITEIYSGSPQRETFVVFLGAFVMLKNTTDGKNFSCTAQDRAIIGVEPEWPRQSWSYFVEEAADNCPPMWSYVTDWGNHSTDVYDMINNQTFFSLSDIDIPGPASRSQDNWDLGDIEFFIRRWGTVGLESFTKDTAMVNWEKTREPCYYDGKAFVNYTVSRNPNYNGPPYLRIRVVLRHAEDPLFEEAGNGISRWKWDTELFNVSYVAADITANSIHDNWNGGDGNISLCGFIAGSAVTMRIKPIAGYKVHMVGEGEGDNSGETDQDEISWVSSTDCAYIDEDSVSESITSSSQGGITTVDVNIYNIISEGNREEHVYTYSADRGDTRVEFSCSS
jgi:hypothetical protein